MRRLTKVLTIVGGGGLLALANVYGATIADLSGGGTVNINSGIFSTTVFQPAGTGVIQPFVRLDQQGNNTYEAGYNTSLGTPLDVLGNSYHRDIQISTLAIETVNGVNYFDFRLDLNQPSGGPKQYITLNQVELFGRSAPADPTGVTMDTTTGRAAGTVAASLGTLVWDMNGGTVTDNAVKLSFDLNKGGSGMGDMVLQVPADAFKGYTYLVFYSQLGLSPITGGSSAEDGFEEWDAVVPEPTTLIAGALLLLPFGASTLRVLRKNRTE